MNRLVQEEDDKIVPLELEKGGHTYRIVYDENTRPAAWRMLGRWASNPGLNFTWKDADVLSQEILREKEKHR